MKHTVIIGGGFAGVNLARELARSADHRITLIDKNNYNFFPPLIYQVAAGFMPPSDISYPFRKLFNRRPNARFRQGEVRRIDPAEYRVYLQHGEGVDYDLLVIATGTRPNFFGNQEIENHAYAMKTLGDAPAIRNNILARLEAACALPPAERALLRGSGEPFAYKHQGDMAIIGRLSAVADFPGGRSSHGILTWAVWAAVHILALVTFRNRLAAAYNWGIAFLTRNQTLRMIIRPTPPADAQNGRDG